MKYIEGLYAIPHTFFYTLLQTLHDTVSKTEGLLHLLINKNTPLTPLPAMTRICLHFTLHYKYMASKGVNQK